MNSNPEQHSAPFFRTGDMVLIAFLSLGYLLLSDLLVDFHSEQIILVLLFNLCYFGSRPSRRFILAFSVFIIYWILFDWMKAFPNYRFNTVHIGDIYAAEKKWFGLNYGGSRITPNEYWLRNGNSILDIFSGICYLTWVPLPLIFAIFLFFRDKKQFFYFAFSFLLVNLIGFVIYYWYPAAPPWYVQQHGFEFIPETRGNMAGLSRFDHYFHLGIFQSIYSKSSNVFAAMPSLHAAYPLLVLYYGIRYKLGAINLFFGLLLAGIWFGAIYASHHYVLDVLAGIACGILGIALFLVLALKNRIVRSGIERMVRLTS
jgi:membrane-associated phospholipid phosphatase